MIKLYIVTYKKNDVLNRNLQTLWAATRHPERLKVTIISNHPDVVVQAENERPHLHVLVNSTRAHNAWGYLSRDWNFGIQDAFVNWRNPDSVDWCVLAQNDVEWINGWDEWLYNNTAFDFVSQPAGDQSIALNINAVRHLGVFDERFCTLHFHEFDYFFRAMLALGDRASINDTHGGDAAAASWNPVGCVLTKATSSGFDAGSGDTLHTFRSYYEMRNLLFHKWDVSDLEAVENKVALVRARQAANLPDPTEVNWHPFFWDEASPRDAPAMARFLSDYDAPKKNWRIVPGGAPLPGSDLSHRIGIVVQGPIATDIDGRKTTDLLEMIGRSPLRNRFYLCMSVWEDEPVSLETFAPLVDLIVVCRKPDRRGITNRLYQTQGVTCAIEALETLPNPPACLLKTRPDILLSERFLQRIVGLAGSENRDEKVLVTNLFTRYEPFHLSDLVVFSSRQNIKMWFDNTDQVYYEDLFAPEVQFARVFIRNRKLSYSHRMEDYLRFLRDWIILVDFSKEELMWFKFPDITTKNHNKIFGLLQDRDVGPALSRLITTDFHRCLLRMPLGVRTLAAYFLASDAVLRAMAPLPFFRRRRTPFTLELNRMEHDRPIPGDKNREGTPAPVTAPIAAPMSTGIPSANAAAFAVTNKVKNQQNTTALYQLPRADTPKDRANVPRIGVVVQGPLQTDLNNHSTREVFETLYKSPLRNRFYVVYAAWEDENPDDLSALAPFVDKMVLCQPPERPGSCHRNFQAKATSQGLEHLTQIGVPFALKTRSDLVLSDRFLETVLHRAAQSGYQKILVTNLFTRVEAFHISDMVVFSTTENLRLWFAPVTVYYEDMYSPEVQFARVFVRARKLPYTLTIEGYFRFLADWVDLVDFYEQGLFWFKDGCGSLRKHNGHPLVVYDRDAGPVMARLMSVRFHRFLQTRKHGFNLLAMLVIVHDAIQRYVVITTPKRLWWYYNVDNKFAERVKAVPGLPVPGLTSPTASAAEAVSEAEAASPVPRTGSHEAWQSARPFAVSSSGGAAVPVEVPRNGT